MDLIFVPQRGRPFMIEVWFYDTVLAIKEKIEKYQGIPVSMQTLIFKGQTLPDDADIEKCVLLNNSRVQLHIAADFFKTQPGKTEEFSPAPSTVKLLINVKTPSSKVYTLEMDANDTVLKLKERIQEIEVVPANNRLAVHLSGNELHDHQMLLDCEICEYSEIEVSLRPLPIAAPATSSGANNGGGGGGGGGSKKLRVMILTKCGKKKIPVDVNPSDNVGELRKELQKLHQRNQLPLPSDGYFFIYGQSVMDDDKSFRWHQVAQGDTIEIFNGSVTGGGS
ncbi:ubiquitin domain-containing protein 7SL RNA1-like [Prosopis cineraria]|uniref:ubiquitin domain-containing protein 7SL RNA1-like n=1 Tax=Prosopis cineraria TaxID=364024 RepID=UPI00240FD5BD|nr:ubiquitin domain-containing protein 7SL RNA1-like [Prosopis cineraria]